MRRRRGLAAILAATVAGLAAIPGAAQAAGRCGDHPWCDRSMSADARAGLLLSQLTLDEKLDLMGGDVDGILHPETSSSTVNGIPRLDVPPLTVNDGPGGIRQGIGADSRPATALPAPLALGASFDPKLAARYAAVIAAEAKRRGHDLVLGPTVNLVRDPRGGRTFESYGEDPRAAERPRASPGSAALQGAGVIADVKHYAANNQETEPLHRRRDHRRAHAARDLPAALRGGGQARARGHRHDGLQQGQRRLHGRQPPARARHAVRRLRLRRLRALGLLRRRRHGRLGARRPEPRPAPAAVLRAGAAARGDRRGPPDHAPRSTTWCAATCACCSASGCSTARPIPRDATIPVKRHGRVARLVEDRGIVLLRNRRSLLPLNARRIDSVAVIGKSADEYQRPNAASSGGVTPFYSVTALQGLRRAARGRFAVRYDDGSDRQARRPGGPPGRRGGRGGRARASLSGEFLDRPCIDLDCAPEPPHQDRLIRAVAAANPRTVVVLQSPGPVHDAVGRAGWARSWRRGGPARRAATPSPTSCSARSTRRASSP